MALNRILEELSEERVWQHLEWLDKNAPSRISGTEGNRRAAEYYVDQLKSYGLDAHLDTFTAYLSVPERGELAVISPTQQEIPCAACAHIASTPDSGIEGELIFVGPGAEEDYAGKEVRDKFVLAEISYAPPRTEKAQIALRHGARAIIYVNWGLPEQRVLPRGAIKSVWGKLTRSTIGQIPDIAAVGICRADGETLRDLAAKGPVRVRLIAQATQEWGSLTQPRARVHGGKSSGDFLLVGGHFDAWEPGTTDNGTGNVLKLELARLFQEHRDELGRDIEFVFFNGHEIGDMEGSCWYLDTHWDDLDEHCVAYFNVDSVGFLGTTRFATKSSPELKRFHEQIEKRILGAPGEHETLTRTGDQSFFGIGIPSLYGQFHHTQEEIAAWHNAILGWWWHSDADTLDKVDRDRFRDTARVYAGYIWEMTTAEILPLDFTTAAENLARRTLEVENKAAGHFTLDLPIAPFREAAEKLQNLIEGIGTRDRRAELVPKVNRTLMRLSRILTPAFATVAGRHAQDRYGLVALKAPIPALYEMGQFVQASPDSQIHHLLATELIRERNKLSDALRRAIETIHAVLELA